MSTVNPRREIIITTPFEDFNFDETGVTSTPYDVDERPKGHWDSAADYDQKVASPITMIECGLAGSDEEIYRTLQVFDDGANFPTLGEAYIVAKALAETCGYEIY